jgi:hypothetical protein
MDFTGNQLRAARILFGVDQATFAKALQIAIGTLQTMESCGAEIVISGFASTRTKVREALEALGVEFLNHGEPGVRLRDPAALSGAFPPNTAKPTPGIRTFRANKSSPAGRKKIAATKSADPKRPSKPRPK